MASPEASGLSVAFRVDGSERIGGGHVLRCLSLADALARQGASVAFVCGSLTPFLEARIIGGNHALLRIAALPDGADWQSPLPDQAQVADARRTLAALGTAPDWIVVDHYRLGQPWEEEAGAPARALLAVDDLANRAHCCRILVDQTFGRRPADYAGLVPEDCTLLTGALYAMLRAEFAAARPAALARRRGGPVRRLLVSLGTTDPGGVAARLIGELLKSGPDRVVDAVLGSAAAGLDRVRALADRHPQLRVHVDADDMAPLIAGADLALGAAGVSSWERCCLGLPSVALVLAENQRMVAQVLEQAGAAVVADEQEAPARLAALAEDEQARLAMSAAAAAIVDGEGIRRIVEQMIGAAPASPGPLTLRPAGEGDAERAWLWRNDPDTRAASQTHQPIDWPSHLRWWRAALASPNRTLMIAELGGEPVATLRFDRDDQGALEVSINLRPDRRGGGLGRAVLAAGLAEMVRRGGPQPFTAAILASNQASRRIFEALGFERSGPLGDRGFERYVRAVKEESP